MGGAPTPKWDPIGVNPQPFGLRAPSLPSPSQRSLLRSPRRQILAGRPRAPETNRKRRGARAILCVSVSVCLCVYGRGSKISSPKWVALANGPMD